MESALYDPVTGFYSTRIPTADFYTAPELHPAFGCILADRLATLLRRVQLVRPNDRLTLLEAGCGDGTLAATVTRRMRQLHPDVANRLHFILIDRSRKDLTTAVRRITAFGVTVEGYTGIEKVGRISGVIYSNELFDAMPAHLIEKNAGKMNEVYVGEDGQYLLRAITSPELATHAAHVAPHLCEGDRHAVSLESSHWLETAATRLTAGFILSIDYGKRFTPETPNVPRAYRQHQLISDLTSDAGFKDLTVPVDFNALITVGEKIGLSLESFQSFSAFLLDNGISSWLPTSSDNIASINIASIKEAAQLKTLLHPDGMGESFKVLLQKKCL